MDTLRLWACLCADALRELCRRFGLLAGLLLLCLTLPLGIGPAVKTLLSPEQGFAPITLAVCAPEGDPVPALLAQYMGNMRDVKEYCTFRAMDRQAAEASLAKGEVSAVLVLPEGFVQGVMDGTNPDVTLLVPGDEPLQALLTYWVGQSAADLLSAAQAGIYAVLDLYGRQPPAGLDRDEVVLGINLRYVQWVLGRQGIFRMEEVPATGTLPVGLHYGLSLLAYLGLALAPLFAGVFAPGRLSARLRLRSLGRGSLVCYCADTAAAAAVAFPLMAAPALLLTGGPVPAVLAAAGSCAVLCAVLGALLCLATPGAASCGALAFTVALAALAAAGGILPPVLLPGTLRAWGWLSPVAWLRAVLALAAGYPADGRCLAAMAGAALLAAAGGAALYRHRVLRQEAAL